ncbi:MAG: excalibur calcium-binding domain-containing protein [Steroidobacter sp.]
MTLKNIALLGAIIAAVAWFSKKQERDTLMPAHQMETDTLLVERPPEFRCEGKTRCVQMSSCEEAMFYLKHCSGTQMDGDGDGVPCETQHCGSH